jgi:hypothetical protein
MTITRPQGPAGGITVLGRFVPHLMSRGPNALRPMGGAPAPQVSQPIRVYTVKLSDIRDEDFPDRAVPTGWRYLIDANGPVAVADLKEVGQGGGPPAFGRLLRGPIVEDLPRAIDYATRQFSSDTRQYEVRILEIPAIYKTAVWLHGPEEIFIPILERGETATAPPPVHEDRQFTSRVVQLASDKKGRP